MMDARKTITFTMDEIKELNFHLQAILEKLQQEIQHIGKSEGKKIYEEKITLLKETMQKLNC